MRIAVVSDVPGWAIGHLARPLVKYNPQHEIRLMYVHPRDAGRKDVQTEFLKEIIKFNPHVIDFEYFRTAGQLIESIPELKNYKKCVMHHNMRDKALYMWDWQNNQSLEKYHLKLDKVLVHCNKTKALLLDNGYAKDVDVIRYGLDHDFWTFSDKEPEEFTLGYAGRFVAWKGLKEISEAAEELDIPVEVMGKEDDSEYWAKVPRKKLKFNFLECEDEERPDFYHSISVFIQNSIDGYEEGTLPLLEAMACGVPVITTPAGQAGPIEGLFKDRINCLMIPFNDKEALKEAITELKNNKELRDQLRQEGWNLVRGMTEEKMAKCYSESWNKICFPNQPLVSVVIPATYDRMENIVKIMKGLENQTYQNIEAVIVWDEMYGQTIKDKGNFDLTIREVWTRENKQNHPYNLGMARNLGVIEAEGEIIMFNDSRLCPDENAVMMFAQAVENAGSLTMGGSNKVWFFGDKGNQKKSFVENFSAVKRSHLVKCGMFSERIDRYGGMTQEIRMRWKAFGGQFIYIGPAVASEISSSKVTPEKRKDIVKAKMLIWKMYKDEEF